jgi:hypothetical protein
VIAAKTAEYGIPKVSSIKAMKKTGNRSQN